jgi:hypothetical protein
MLSPSKLTITKTSSTVTLGVCEHCNSQFKCYLPNPDQAMWELKAWYVGHVCDPVGKRPKTLRVAFAKGKRPRLEKLEGAVEIVPQED